MTRPSSGLYTRAGALAAAALILLLAGPPCLQAAAVSGLSLYPPTLSDSVALDLAREFRRDRENTCTDLPGTIAPINARTDGTCRHPLDQYIRATNDSIFIDSGGKAALAAYRSFRRIAPNPRPPAINHTEFLSLVEMPKEQDESWLKRKINQVLGWTFEHLLRFLSPLAERLWRNLSGPARTMVIIGAALVLLFFIALIGRSLVHSRFVQRGLDSASSLTITAVTPVRWLDKADEELRSGDYRATLTCLYRWLTAWVTDHNVVGRHQWWTNRQLMSALAATGTPVLGVAKDIVSRYEDAEYGHRPVDPAAIRGLCDNARGAIGRGRP